MRDQIVQAVTAELWDSPFANDRSQATPAIIGLSNLLAGVTDELVAKSAPDAVLQDIGKRIAQLREIVEKNLARSANRRFVPDRTWS
jgi:hypothetical protein